MAKILGLDLGTNSIGWAIRETENEGAKQIIESLYPVQKLSGEIKSPTDDLGATYQGKTFEQLQDENPEALADLEKDNPEAYQALFADWKKRNRIK